MARVLVQKPFWFPTRNACVKGSSEVPFRGPRLKFADHARFPKRSLHTDIATFLTRSSYTNLVHLIFRVSPTGDAVLQGLDVCAKEHFYRTVSAFLSHKTIVNYRKYHYFYIFWCQTIGIVMVFLHFFEHHRSKKHGKMKCFWHQ